MDGRGLQWPVGITEIVGTRAEIGLLGHAASGMDHYGPEAVGMGAITEAGLVVQGQIPRVVNARPLVHKGNAVDLGTEAAQDKQSPGVERLGGPTAEQGPAVFPEKHPEAIAQTPGACVAVGLVVGVHIQAGIRRWAIGAFPRNSEEIQKRSMTGGGSRARRGQLRPWQRVARGRGRGRGSPGPTRLRDRRHGG